MLSMTALLSYRPNDTLIYTALYRYLVVSNTAGLHRFKTKVGFEARPVHRAFVVHPPLRPLANRFALWGLNTVLRFRPTDRRLKKAGGVLASMLGDTSMFNAVAIPVDEGTTTSGLYDR
jgi:hypothetical protein